MNKKTWATVIRYGGVGDNLIASSVFKGLKAKYDYLEVLTQEPQNVVFENNPFIDKLVVMKKDQIPKEAWAEWHYLRSKETDGFFHLSHSCETLTAYLPGQVQFTWPADARRKFAGRSYLEVVHDICGLDYDCISPNFYPTEEEHADAERVKKNKIGGRYIAWVLTGTRLDKIYPWTSHAIARLIQELNIAVVMIGGPGKDHEIAKTMQQEVERTNGSTKGLHSAISYNADNPNWPLRRVLTLVQHADLVIGPDTGPMWAVAMHDLSKIMLLSHASPENITKHWRNTYTLHASTDKVPSWPCHKLHDVPGTCVQHPGHPTAACISSIGVDLIMHAAKAALGCKPSKEELLRNWGSNVTLRENLAPVDTSLNASLAQGTVSSATSPESKPSTKNQESESESKLIIRGNMSSTNTNKMNGADDTTKTIKNESMPINESI